MRAKLIHILLLLAALGGSFACNRSSTYVSKSSEKPSKYYTSSFPGHDVSRLLSDAQNSVLRIISTAYYTIYRFDEGLTLEDIRTNRADVLSTSRKSKEISTAGSSILLSYNSSLNKALLISCAHVVSFPDTVITYYTGPNGQATNFVKDIRLKKQQNNLLFTPSELYDFQIIIADTKSDITLLSVSIDLDQRPDIFPLSMKWGDINFLQAGSFIYVMGFPKGYPVITRGIANPQDIKSRSFFISDALFNPGISGGLVIGSNDNFNSFQWLGMASSSTVSVNNVLVPRPSETTFERRAEAYSDSVFVKEQTQISYGITRAIHINKIKSFLREHKKLIKSEGFDL